MATRDEKFRLAARAYVVYGVIYWLGGLVLAAGGLGPRGMGRSGLAWFAVGAVLVVIVPWLLLRERGWFDRWVLSRRDFGRVLSVLVAIRAFEVARIARGPRTETISALGVAVPLRAGAWVFVLLTVATAVLLARAAWSRES